jgi:hypothetical protein
MGLHVTIFYLHKDLSFFFDDDSNKNKYHFQSRESSVGIVTGYGLEQGFDSRQRHKIFLFSMAFRPALEPTQPPIKWAPEALFLGVKRPGYEAHHSPPSSAEVMNGETIPPLPIRLYGLVLN